MNEQREMGLRAPVVESRPTVTADEAAALCREMGLKLGYAGFMNAMNKFPLGVCPVSVGRPYRYLRDDIATWAAKYAELVKLMRSARTVRQQATRRQKRQMAAQQAQEGPIAPPSGEGRYVTSLHMRDGAIQFIRFASQGEAVQHASDALLRGGAVSASVFGWERVFRAGTAG